MKLQVQDVIFPEEIDNVEQAREYIMSLDPEYNEVVTDSYSEDNISTETIQQLKTKDDATKQALGTKDGANEKQETTASATADIDADDPLSTQITPENPTNLANSTTSQTMPVESGEKTVTTHDGFSTIAIICGAIVLLGICLVIAGKMRKKS